MVDARYLTTPGDFGVLIRERRRALSMSQAQFAEKLGSSRRWVTDIEAGKETAELGRVLHALRVLNIHLVSKPEQVYQDEHQQTGIHNASEIAELLAHRNKNISQVLKGSFLNAVQSVPFVGVNRSMNLLDLFAEDLSRSRNSILVADVKTEEAAKEGAVSSARVKRITQKNPRSDNFQDRKKKIILLKANYLRKKSKSDG